MFLSPSASYANHVQCSGISPKVRTAWVKLSEALRESYWFIPAIMVGCSVGLALLSISMGNLISAKMLGQISWIYTRDPQAARDLLAMVGGSLITVAGVIFSVTLVALTNASSQFGTRILRTFARDTGNKVVLGAFVGTFLYCLLVMRPITGGQNSFVPHLAILIAILLAMLCFGLLIYFIHHVIGILQSDNVITALCNDLKESIRRMYPEELKSQPENNVASMPDDFGRRCVAVNSQETNYIESFADEKVLSLAEEHGLVIRAEKMPGNFVLQGTPLAYVYPAESISDELHNKIRKTFNMASRRSYVQDIGFGFEQLVLVAVRAISPAVNNQILAMSCVDRISEALALLASRKIPSPAHLDKEGNLRVLSKLVDYGSAVELAFGLIAESAKTSPRVTTHMLIAIAELLQVSHPPAFRAALMDMASRIRDQALPSIQDNVGQQDVIHAYAAVVQKTVEHPKAA